MATTISFGTTSLNSAAEVSMKAINLTKTTEEIVVSSQRLRKKHYTKLIEVSVATGVLTGRVKANLPSDPDYINPIQL